MSEESQILTFSVAGTEFGIPLPSLIEVVRLVEMHRMEGIHGLSEGVINYRGTVIPVADLRRGLGFAPRSYGPDADVLVAEFEGDKVGLVVDEVLQVLTIPEGDIEMPGQGVPLRQFLTGVAKLEEGLVFILNVQSVLTADHVMEAPIREGYSEDISPRSEEDRETLRRRARDLSRPVEARAGEKEALSTFIRFTLGQGIYAVRGDFSKEIVTPPAITPIPCTPDYILGAANIRGAILPVLDLSAFLRLTNGADDSDPGARRILIVEGDSALLGLEVDKVLGVTTASSSQIAPPLATLDEDVAGFIEGEIDWEGDAVVVISTLTILRALEEM